MKQPLTIVLPMHNQVHRIRSMVMDVLELTELAGGIEVIVVDDGSTDDTFETACEMARTFPQVQVLRQATPRGLPSAVELVRRKRPGREMVLVHDGSTAFNAVELKHLLEQRSEQAGRAVGKSRAIEAVERNAPRKRVASTVGLHHEMERQHRRFSGFHWMRLDRPLVPRRREPQVAPATDGPTEQSGRGLPIANYLTSLPMGIPSAPASL